LIKGDSNHLLRTDADVADTWDKEILRRLAELDAGTAPRFGRADFPRRIQARIATG
jgi:hypothetical protein